MKILKTASYRKIEKKIKLSFEQDGYSEGTVYVRVVYDEDGREFVIDATDEPEGMEDNYWPDSSKHANKPKDMNGVPIYVFKTIKLRNVPKELYERLLEHGQRNTFPFSTSKPPKYALGLSYEIEKYKEKNDFIDEVSNNRASKQDSYYEDETDDEFSDGFDFDNF